ncbi:phytanoyl-CoA dioxygenase family protein [Paenibacillus cymbidii]|uniref:phytanoyl-CoA dioxygenase family protein n=1 Tax=Paenibacillus cymbidii TaxID=1639034 RepID=UPI00143697EE|nr:phytanoyl-CoA dioxygenase family protein [Paenibacillus cymbidii]
MANGETVVLQEAAQEHLLDAKQMARFVTDGYLTFDEIVPREINEAVLAEQIAFGSGSDFWNHSKHIRRMVELPEVRGIIQSLVGRSPGYDHSHQHIVGPHNYAAQDWHADSIIDTRPYGFDVQLFYFTHDAPTEMGPTLILPGSHLRKVNTFSIARYKNIVGQKQLACKAGTLAVLHHGMWHCAQPNRTDRTRYVFKLRLRPGQEQRGLFRTEGSDSPEVARILSGGYQPWQGNEARLDHVQRAKLWRYVTGDDSIDFSFEGALTRMGIS